METCTYCDKPIFVKQTSHGPLCNGHYAQHRRGKPISQLRDYKHQEMVPDNRDVCPFPECGRTSWHKHGYCQTHQRQLWEANGDEKTLRPIREHTQQTGKGCHESGCDRPAKSRGFCSKHYRQDWGQCELPACNRRKHNKKTGLCARHYQRFRKMNLQQPEVANAK